MKEYVLDANAVLVYLEDRVGADKVRHLFEQTERQQVRLSMSVVNWGEIFYVLAKKSGNNGHDKSSIRCAREWIFTRRTLGRQS